MNRPVHEHDLPDTELVRRAQRGSPAAFGVLVARYQDRVYNACYRMCHNDADALDLTQSAFLKALNALPRFEQRANFYTWLFRIAMNLAISHVRSSRRRRTLPLETEDRDGESWTRQPVDNREATAEAPAELDETRHLIACGLARLDPDFRAAVVLKDIEDLDYASIAEVLEIPVGTVKSRIHRGRLMLREYLQAQRSNLEPPQA